MPVCKTPLSLCAGTIIAVSFLTASPLHADNLHLIDQRPNGFRIYRSGAPSRADIQEWCRRGIRDVMVLSGEAASREGAFHGECPGLRVIYNEAQNAAVPLTKRFLRRFDDWVRKSRAQGKKILFRCYCGCHRTGRLAAYYEMKFMGYTYRQARQHMYRFGQNMDAYPYLFKQVRALQDYIHGRPCSRPKAYCVQGAS